MDSGRKLPSDQQKWSESVLSALPNPTSCQLPVAVGEWTTWDAAVYSNFTFSRPSREINISVISIISALLGVA